LVLIKLQKYSILFVYVYPITLKQIVFNVPDQTKLHILQFENTFYYKQLSIIQPDYLLKIQTFYFVIPCRTVASFISSSIF
jgi:hypothetical protein